MGFSPNPPPQAARAFVRQLFGKGVGQAPAVSATLLDHADGGPASSLEFVNEGGVAENLVCLVGTDGGIRQLELGSVGPGQSTAVRVEVTTSGGDVRCVWLCSDERGEQHVWSYDGRHQHTKGPRRLTAEAAFREFYPGPD